jgi:hypothetical protein
MALVVSVELATWNAVDVESSPAIVKTDESKECHVPAHCEARGMSSNKQRSSMSDLADPCSCFPAGRMPSRCNSSADTGTRATWTSVSSTVHFKALIPEAVKRLQCLAVP